MQTLAYMRGVQVARLPVGFSWTTFFFGFLPSLCRGHLAFVFVSLVMDIYGILISALVFHGYDCFLSSITVRIIAATMRNVHLHRYMRNRGWFLGDAAQVVQFPANDRGDYHEAQSQ